MLHLNLRIKINYFIINTQMIYNLNSKNLDDYCIRIQDNYCLTLKLKLLSFYYNNYHRIIKLCK